MGVLRKFDKDGDGEINFDEWMQLMKAAWKNKHVFTFSPSEDAGTPGGAELDQLQPLSDTSPADVYDVLATSFAPAAMAPQLSNASEGPTIQVKKYNGFTEHTCRLVLDLANCMKEP